MSMLKRRLLVMVTAAMVALGILGAAAVPVSAAYTTCAQNTWCTISAYGYTFDSSKGLAVRWITSYNYYWSGIAWSKGASSHSCTVYESGWGCSYVTGEFVGAMTSTYDTMTSASYNVNYYLASSTEIDSETLTKNGITSLGAFGPTGSFCVYWYANSTLISYGCA